MRHFIRSETLLIFRNHKKIMVFATVIFALLTVLYVGRGLQGLLFSFGGATDLHTNWDELRLVLDGTNPYKNSSPSPYPPFAHLTNIVFLWPSWPAVRYYFALVSLICLGLVAGWAYRVGAWRDAWFASALAMSVPATSALSTGLGLGQNTILYTALLILALQLRDRGQGAASGLVLGIAMSKISIAMPFLLLFLFRKDWCVLIGAGAYIFGATAVLSVWLNESPLDLVQHWIPGAERMACIDYSPATFICRLGVPANTANRACEAVVMLGAAAVFAWRRKLSLVTLFGIAAGFGRLWTYHRVYDNFMLVILLVAIADAYLRTKRWQLCAAMLAVGITLWLPPKAADLEVIQALHLALWGAATIALAIWAPRAEKLTADAVPTGLSAAEKRCFRQRAI